MMHSTVGLATVVGQPDSIGIADVLRSGSAFGVAQ